jgi:LCP family protein required for cell wall assembly
VGKSKQDKDSNPKKKMSKKKKIILIIVAVIVALLLAAGIAFALYIQNIDNKIQNEPEDQNQIKEVLAPEPKEDEPYYVLLLGSDSRTPGDYSGNSDTIVLARIDPKTPQATLISIPRDTEIDMEGYGAVKINAARPYGGEVGAISEISKLTGTEISHFIEIDFEGVIGLVDALGGIEVDVPVDIDLDGVHISPGLQTLDGPHALIMSRCRSFPAGDYVRVENQRLLLQAVAKKILAVSPTEMPGLIGQLAGCVKTDVSVAEAADLLIKLRGMNPENMYMATIPSYNNYHDGTSFIAIKEPEYSQMMERVRQGLSPIDPAAEAAAAAAQEAEAAAAAAAENQ